MEDTLEVVERLARESERLQAQIERIFALVAECKNIEILRERLKILQTEKRLTINVTGAGVTSTSVTGTGISGTGVTDVKLTGAKIPDSKTTGTNANDIKATGSKVTITNTAGKSIADAEKPSDAPGEATGWRAFRPRW